MWISSDIVTKLPAHRTFIPKTNKYNVILSFCYGFRIFCFTFSSKSKVERLKRKTKKPASTNTSSLVDFDKYHFQFKETKSSSLENQSESLFDVKKELYIHPELQDSLIEKNNPITRNVQVRSLTELGLQKYQFSDVPSTRHSLDRIKEAFTQIYTQFSPYISRSEDFKQLPLTIEQCTFLETSKLHLTEEQDNFVKSIAEEDRRNLRMCFVRLKKAPSIRALRAAILYKYEMERKGFQRFNDDLIKAFLPQLTDAGKYVFLTNYQKIDQKIGNTKKNIEKLNLGKQLGQFTQQEDMKLLMLYGKYRKRATSMETYRKIAGEMFPRNANSVKLHFYKMSGKKWRTFGEK